LRTLHWYPFLRATSGSSEASSIALAASSSSPTSFLRQAQTELIEVTPEWWKRRIALELASLAPYIEKDLADEVFATCCPAQAETRSETP
jgi:hypothetical protein